MTTPSISFYREKPRTFTWEDITFGLRLPSTAEMTDITQMRDEYFASMTEENPVGDNTLMVKYQFFIGALLTCAPDDVKIPWFAVNEDEQKKFKAAGVDRQLPSDFPHPFFSVVAKEFNEYMSEVQMTAAEKKAAAGDSEEGKLANGTGKTPIPPNSEGTSSVSADTSSAPKETSNNFATTSS